MEGQTTSGSTHHPSAITRDDSSQPGHIESDEPESLVDFILSHDGRIIESSDTKMLVQNYHREYQKRLRFLQSKVLSLQKELRSAKKEEKRVKKLEKDEAIIKSSIEWNKARMQSAIEDRKEQKKTDFTQ